jgi:cytochrome oxidase assembly protein ShyY1
VYRFLLSPRWLGLGLLMVVAAAVMVGLGLWQLDRYEYRSEINARIDAAGSRPAVPLGSVLAAPADGLGPAPANGVGPAPSPEAAWALVVVTGHYDPAHEVLARSRSRDGRVGFEVVTPLVLADGSAILVDRGWLPPTSTGSTTPPVVPPAPAGTVTVTGRVHAPESRADAAVPFGGKLSVRRIAPAQLAAAVGRPLYGAYLTLESQSPPADPAFAPIAPTYENAAMNAGYVVQWWLLAALTLTGYGYLAVRERRAQSGPDDHTWDESDREPRSPMITAPNQ